MSSISAALREGRRNIDRAGPGSDARRTRPQRIRRNEAVAPPYSALFRLIRPLQKAHRSSPHPPGIDPAGVSDRRRREAPLGVSGATSDAVHKRAWESPSQSLKELPLASGQVVSNAVGRNIAARKERHAHHARRSRGSGSRCPALTRRPTSLRSPPRPSTNPRRITPQHRRIAWA